MLKCGCATEDVSGWLATWQEGKQVVAGDGIVF